MFPKYITLKLRNFQNLKTKIPSTGISKSKIGKKLKGWTVTFPVGQFVKELTNDFRLEISFFHQKSKNGLIEPTQKSHCYLKLKVFEQNPHKLSVIKHHFLNKNQLKTQNFKIFNEKDLIIC